MKVIFSPAAKADFRDILDYIYERNPAAAYRLVEELAEFCLEVLGANPHAGRSADELVPGLKIISKRNYRICYRVLETEVEIGRLIHSARDLDRLLRETGIS